MTFLTEDKLKMAKSAMKKVVRIKDKENSSVVPCFEYEAGSIGYANFLKSIDVSKLSE